MYDVSVCLMSKVVCSTILNFKMDFDCSFLISSSDACMLMVEYFAVVSAL